MSGWSCIRIPRTLYEGPYMTQEDRLGGLLGLDMSRDDKGRLVNPSHRVTVMEAWTAILGDVRDEWLKSWIKQNGKP